MGRWRRGGEVEGSGLREVRGLLGCCFCVFTRRERVCWLIFYVCFRCVLAFWSYCLAVMCFARTRASLSVFCRVTIVTLHEVKKEGINSQDVNSSSLKAAGVHKPILTLL